MKFFPKTLAITLMALASTATLAADPLVGVAGFDPTFGSATVLTPGPVNGNSYTIAIGGQVGVSFESVSGLSPYANATDGPTKQRVGLYKLPAGTAIYAFGLGRQWGNMPEELAQIDLAKAKAKATFNGSEASYGFVAASRCEVVTFVAVLPNGTRMWASHPEDGWSTPNVNGSPMTGWCVDGTTVKRLDAAVKTALAAKK